MSTATTRARAPRPCRGRPRRRWAPVGAATRLAAVVAVSSALAGVCVATFTADPAAMAASSAGHTKLVTASVVGQSAPAGIGRLDAVSCVAPSWCWAVSATPSPTAPPPASPARPARPPPRPARPPPRPASSTTGGGSPRHRPRPRPRPAPPPTTPPPRWPSRPTGGRTGGCWTRRSPSPCRSTTSPAPTAQTAWRWGRNRAGGLSRRRAVHTTDGGQSWHELPGPAGARGPAPP